MSFEYIGQAYGKKFHKGQRVLALGKPGVVKGATHLVEVQLDGMKFANPYHPSDVKPADEPGVPRNEGSQRQEHDGSDASAERDLSMNKSDSTDDICGLCGEAGADKVPHPNHWPGENAPNTTFVHDECEQEECARAHSALMDRVGEDGIRDFLRSTR